MYLFSNELEKANTASKISLSKGSPASEFSVDGNLYFTSIRSTGSWLYNNLQSSVYWHDKQKALPEL